MSSEKINHINKVLKKYFELNKSVSSIPAKDMMPYFIKNGIFVSDQKMGLPIRRVLRELDEKNLLHLIPFVYAERKLKNTNWFFRSSNYNPPIETALIKEHKPNTKKAKSSTRKNSDEHYVIDLCDEVLGLTGSRQQKFDFLLGDANEKGQRAKLPVDVFYETLNLVIEFQEQQHTKAVKHFDKPTVLTISGVHRGEQRKIYDQRKRTELPKHGIQVIHISYDAFDCSRQNKIIRNTQKDKLIIKQTLKTFI